MLRRVKLRNTHSPVQDKVEDVDQFQEPAQLAAIVNMVVDTHSQRLRVEVVGGSRVNGIWGPLHELMVWNDAGLPFMQPRSKISRATVL